MAYISVRVFVLRTLCASSPASNWNVSCVLFFFAFIFASFCHLLFFFVCHAAVWMRVSRRGSSVEASTLLTSPTLWWGKHSTSNSQRWMVTEFRVFPEYSQRASNVKMRINTWIYWGTSYPQRLFIFVNSSVIFLFFVSLLLLVTETCSLEKSFFFCAFKQHTASKWLDNKQS